MLGIPTPPCFGLICSICVALGVICGANTRWDMISRTHLSHDSTYSFASDGGTVRNMYTGRDRARVRKAQTADCTSSIPRSLRNITWSSFHSSSRAVRTYSGVPTGEPSMWIPAGEMISNNVSPSTIMYGVYPQRLRGLPESRHANVIRRGPASPRLRGGYHSAGCEIYTSYC